MKRQRSRRGRAYNGPYTDEHLNRVAFPVGGLGAGMFCVEGTGALSHVSVRNQMEFFHEPCAFAALCVKGAPNIARVLEGPVPLRKYFGPPGTGNGATGTSYGLPRFARVTFEARFPFATVSLADDAVPLRVSLCAWSPFLPGNADDSSLPVGALEYSFENPTAQTVEAVFSFHTKNFLAVGNEGHTIGTTRNGFVLRQEGTGDKPHIESAMAFFVDDDGVVVDHCWFKGGWWDALTLAWRNVQEALLRANPPVPGPSPGASLFVPLRLEPGESKTVRLMTAWYTPKSDIRVGNDPQNGDCTGGACCCGGPPKTYVPWYAGRFADLEDVADYWRAEVDRLRAESARFRDTFYDTSLPAEVIEAVAANLTILKSPTVLRQTDGSLWCWEGCCDAHGCCHGSCTHVWNYAQALAHLFPALERSLRQSEFFVSQDARGHQAFRTSLPIRPTTHEFHAAADGQLGGIMKVYREWRISGDRDWLAHYWPQVRQSLDYCIATWDPRECGAIEEPHHNTYDIEFWGPDGMCTSFYVGALAAAVAMGRALGDDVWRYQTLLERSRDYLETTLFNGEYFFQIIRTEGLNAQYQPLDASTNGPGYSDVVALLNAQGPRYQYGTGCLSDGVLGLWMARMCGLGELIDPARVKSHLAAVHRYNLRHDLSRHANPQRPGFALGDDGGLLLCTWPHGGALAIPFVYSDEVWTGIEYQVASHLMLEGLVEEGLEIVRLCRDRYDGTRRNPFNEYECGHWYARALSSYGLLQGLTGVRYDAVERTLYIDSRVGPSFRSFLATETGYGTVGLRRGKPFLRVVSGTIAVERFVVADQEITCG